MLRPSQANYFRHVPFGERANAERLRAGFKAEYPFASHFLDLDGLRYHYVDEGAGPTLLMVHGNPTWSFAWRNLIKAYAPRYRVLAVDHIGCGFSDKPQNYPYRLAQHVDNLKRLVTHLDLREVTLFAHDWGGAIGMGVAAAEPERFSRFVLMNTAAFRSTRIPLRIAVCRVPGSGSAGDSRFESLLSGGTQDGGGEARAPGVRRRRGYLMPYRSWRDRVAVLRFVQDIPLSQSHPSYGTLAAIEESLSQFRDRPMLLIWGERDWCFTPAFLERVPAALSAGGNGPRCRRGALRL